MRTRLASLFAALGLCLPLARAAHAAINPWQFAFQPHPGTHLPLSTPLIDENGHTVELGRFFSRTPVILVLEYLHCKSLCRVTLQNLIVVGLGAIPLQAGRDFQLVAISIDPRDKPSDAAAAKTKYLKLYDRPGAAAGVHFLTGPSAPVRKIADAVGFPYKYEASLDEYVHPAGIVVASADGLISRYIEGVDFTPSNLTNALASAEQNKSLGPLSRLLLLCHVQGAPLGRFTIPILAAFTTADIAAGIILFAVFSSILRRRNG